MKMASAIKPVSERDRFHDQLVQTGYCIVADAMPVHIVQALAGDLDPHFEATPASRGAFYGADTRRFGGLLTRSAHAAPFVQHSLVLDIVERVLGPWCDHVALNLTQAIELMPGAVHQVPHRDQDMWPCRRLLEPGHPVEFLVNVMWALTPYTADNGATRIWPGSHKRQAEALIDPDEAIAAEMDPGSALLFLGSTLHAGGANRTRHPRRGMIVSYNLGWLKPYELQWLAYPPDIARGFSTALAALVGYRIHRPNLGNVEGRCPSHLLGSDSASLGAIDALADEHESLIAQFRAGALQASPQANLS